MASLSVDDIVKIATASAQAAAREFAASTRTVSIEAASHAASSNSIKKVELPTFDKTNIHTWIRRVEAAFGRAGVTLSKDKFFFIESKLDVNLNPKINEFLCGESTEERWDEFLEYLQNEYGRSKEQQAALFLRGIPREGLRPTQHLAKIRDLTKDVKLDDLIKEMVLKDLPANIRQSLAERTELSADDTAKAADHYFEKDGRPKHKATTTEVNNVAEAPNLTDTEEEAEQVNAINRNKFRGARPNRGGSRQFTKNPNTAPAEKPRNANTSINRSQPTLQRICRAHINYGEKAWSCEPGCQFKPKQQQRINQSGNGPAGRRQ